VGRTARGSSLRRAGVLAERRPGAGHLAGSGTAVEKGKASSVGVGDSTFYLPSYALCMRCKHHFASRNCIVGLSLTPLVHAYKFYN
jgi:hypothetical protein